MTTCIHCGAFIDKANPQVVFYSAKIGIYECEKCHNADINKDVETEDKKLINPAEAFVIVVTVVVIVTIFYLVL